MTPDQIEAVQPTSPNPKTVIPPEGFGDFWLSEIALQLSALRMEMNEVVKILRTVHKVPQEKPKSFRSRVWYATEHVPTLPVVIDKISRERPAGTNYHIVHGFSKEDALNKIVSRLTAERSDSHQE